MGIKYNGVHSDTIGVYVEHPPGRTMPERDLNIIHVPGRNRDVIIDNGGYKNVSREYEVSIGSEQMTFDEAADILSKWLYSNYGYARLEDDYDLGHYRYAMVSGETEIENILGHAARATVTFDCGPQRFLVSGDEPIHITYNTTITNPTNQRAIPLIVVRMENGGTGRVVIGSYSFQLKLNDTGTEVDYVKDSSNANVLDSDSNPIGESLVTEIFVDSRKGTVTPNAPLKEAPSWSYNGSLGQQTRVYEDFPELPPGRIGVSFSGNIREVIIYPYWWEL